MNSHHYLSIAWLSLGVIVFIVDYVKGRRTNDAFIYLCLICSQIWSATS